MKKYIILFILLFSLTGCSNKEVNNNYITKDEVINNILTYNLDSKIDYNFLKWIDEKYHLESLLNILDTLKNNNYNLDTWHEITGASLNVLYDLYKDNYKNSNNIKIVNSDNDSTNIKFVGDISLADNWHIMPYYDSRGQNVYGILSEEVVNEMTSADIMVGNNEFTFSTRGNPLPNKYYTFRANPSRVSIYDEMGIDLVTIANNHAYDYGEEAFLDTLDTLNNANIAYVGGGRNIDEATSAYYYIINGYKISFVAATRAEKYILTPEATDNTSGVFRCYDPSLLINTIKKEKEESDFVIVLVHWGKEGSSSLEEVIKETGKMYIDAGASLIIGSHAHMLQGIEYYKDKLIVYNLGNFIFNKETIDTGIVSMNINSLNDITYKFIPARQENYKTSLVYNEDKDNIINKLNELSINVNIDKEGNILNKVD